MNFLFENASWMNAWHIDENNSHIILKFWRSGNKIKISQKKLKDQKSKWLWISQTLIEDNEAILSNSEIYSQLRLLYLITLLIKDGGRTKSFQTCLCQLLLHNEYPRAHEGVYDMYFYSWSQVYRLAEMTLLQALSLQVTLWGSDPCVNTECQSKQNYNKTTLGEWEVGKEEVWCSRRGKGAKPLLWR